MRRTILSVIFAVTLTSFLTACGSVTTATQTFISPCDGTYYDAIAWSPDGAHIAFAASSIRGKPTLYIMNPDGSAVQRINAKPVLARHLQWLPDSRALAYADRDQVMAVTPDGVTTSIHVPAREIFSLAFSPDGQSLAYHNGDSIYVKTHVGQPNSADSELIKLSNGALQSWSPDGSWIATIQGNAQKRVSVYLIRPDGSETRRLVDGTEPVRWSPDGQWLSYFSYKGDELHIIRTDGTGDALIAHAPGLYHSATWTDNSHIAFVASADKLLKLVDVNTLVVRPLSTVKAAYQPAPSWSPDGTQVALIGVDPHTNPTVEIQDIYVINRDGTRLVRLTDNPARYQCFHWPF